MLLHSFIVLVCEFNPMERKIHFRENWLIFLEIWGEAEFFRDLGSKGKILSGS